MNELEQFLLDSRDTIAVLRTDGHGNVIRIHGPTRDAAVDLAEAIDIAIAAIARLAENRDELGRFQTAVLLYDKGTVFCGQFASGEAIALLASSNANLGLLLNQVRRLISEESGSKDYAA